MCSFKSIYFVIFILNLYKTYAEISDKRLCVDPECNEPASLAKTLLRYSSPDPRILSFTPNAEVTIYSKEAGSETSLWGVKINGKRGYVPKHLLREYKIYKKPSLLVDTELKEKPQVPKKVDKNDIDPNSVKEPYEVVDGTTIYLNPQDSVNPSSTEDPILSTALPPGSATIVDQKTAAVDGLKEKDTAQKENTEESLVNNVLSTFSNWMDDETDSEEIEAEDDDEEGEDDEEDEEEESEEVETDKKPQKLIKNVDQDINSVHNLPPGVKISPYGLEVDQSLSETASPGKEDDMENHQPLQQESKKSEVASDSPLSTNSKETLVDTGKDVTGNDNLPNAEYSEASLADNENPSAAENVNPPSGENLAIPSKSENIDASLAENGNAASADNANPLSAESANLPSGEDVSPSFGENADLLATENAGISTSDTESFDSSKRSQTNDPEELNKETVDSVNTNSKEESEPAGEELVMEEVTTPSVLDATEQGYLKPEAIYDTLPSQDIDENKNEVNNLLIPETTPDLLKTVENPDSSPPDNSVEPENPTIKEEKDLPNSFYFDKLVDLTEDVEENTKNANEESSDKETETDSSSPNDYQHYVNSVPSGNVEGVQNNGVSEVSDASSIEVSNSVEAQTEQSLFFEEVPSSIDVDNNIETTDTINENELLTNQEQSKEEENNQEEVENIEIKITPEEAGDAENGGVWSWISSFLEGSQDGSATPPPSEHDSVVENVAEENVWVSQDHGKTVNPESNCDATSEPCNTSQQEALMNRYELFDNIDFKFNSDFFLLLVTTAGSVIVFLFVYMALDRHKREAPLVARINKLEKELLITLKENELLQEKDTSAVLEFENVPNELVEQLTQRLAEAQFAQQGLEEKVAELEKQLESKFVLEEQIENLEKELETSTEVGMELNRIISEMLDPTNGSDRLRENMEQLQRQLLEQKDTINSISGSLREKETENRTLRSDLERTKKAAADFQSKVDEMVERVLKIEREKDQQQSSLQSEIIMYQQKYNEAVAKEELLNSDIQILRVQLSEIQRHADIKTKEYQLLKDGLDKMKSMKNNSEAMKSLLDSTAIRAEIQQLKAENAAYAAQLQQEQAVKVGFEKKYQAVTEEINVLKGKYEQADKEKVEVNSKLEVLNNYFKKRESELQEEIIRYKSIWDAKEGAATSTTERIKYMQEEIESYKAQNETLKQEIMSQEIDLKSQISVLEKKVHENWVTARQMERKLEDARQEAAQLRNRLTLRERAINEDRIQNRLQSPVDQNGELPLSPHPIESAVSPPLLYGARDHITKSPPIPGLPPFLPPPPGAPFMHPPLHGMPPFMPPPPSMFPGDHRPPPLGRMSSPPLNQRYSPDMSAFSPYDRRSPSPPYDSEYGASPPPIRGYSPYNGRDDRRDYKRPPHIRSNGRNAKGSVMSSGSDHSNDSLDKLNRKQSKMV